jgi:hypothetical protein
MSNTPILDREQPVPKVTSKRWLTRLVVPLLVGGVIGVLLDSFDIDIDVEKLGAFLSGRALLIGFLPAFYFAVLVHELGHVVAGLSAGLELRTLMVGAFLLTREARGWKVRFTPRRILAGGLAGLVPKSADRLTERYTRLVLGGPAASVLLLAITVILTVIFPGSDGVRVLLFVNLFIVISASLPYTLRSHSSDAKVILLLIRKGPAAERLTAMLYILALDTQQIEPRDWPRELVEKMNIPTKDQAFLISAVSICYGDAMDSGDAERIAETIERALSVNHARPDVRRAFYLAASCFQSMFRNNLPLAEAWLEDARKVKGAISQKDWDSKALAGIALAKGEHAQARELLTRYLAVVDRLPRTGALSADRARTIDLLGRSEGAAA